VTPQPVRVAAVQVPDEAPPAIAASAAPSTSFTIRVTLLGIDDTRNSAAGGRLQIDLWSRGRWYAGAALASETLSQPLGLVGTYDVTGAMVIGYAGERFESGGWSIAPAIGVGAAGWSYQELDPPQSTSGYDSAVVTEGSLTVSRAIGDRFELSAAAIAQWFPFGWSQPEPYGVALAAGIGWKL
jgi:hypothetical protein